MPHSAHTPGGPHLLNTIQKGTARNPESAFRKLLIDVAVSKGRRNTKLEIYLQESQELKSVARLESNGTLPWLGSD